MTDHVTEQQAAALWRSIEARIDAKLEAARNRQSGIVPNTAYGSVKFDAAGHAIWGGAGGGAVGILVASGSTASQVTYTNGADTLINFGEDYDPSSQYVAGVFTAATSARYMLQCQSCYVHPFASAYAANTGCLLFVYRNTSDSMGALDDGTVGAAVASTSWFMLLHGSFTLALDAGETVGVHFQNNSGASRKLNLGATLNIYKVT